MSKKQHKPERRENSYKTEDDLHLHCKFFGLKLPQAPVILQQVAENDYMTSVVAIREGFPRTHQMLIKSCTSKIR